MEIKKIKSIFLTSVKAILNNKGRNFLTIFGIIIGISAVITIMSVGNGLKQKASGFSSAGDSDGQVTLQAKNMDVNSQLSFTDYDVQLAKTLPGVEKVEKVNSDMPVQSNVKIGDKASQQNIKLQNNNKSFTLINGDYLKSNAFSLGLNQVLISDKLNHKLKTYNHGRNTIFINQKGYQIKGVFSENEDSDILMPQKTYLRNFDNNSNQDTINVYVQKGFNKQATLKKLVKLLQTKSNVRSTAEFKLIDKDAGMQFIGKIIDYITYFIIFVASISLFIAGIGVMNTMYMIISERNQEIGIRRAFGATKNDIRFQFLVESSLLTFIGGVGGIILGMVFGYLIGLVVPFKPVTSLESIFISVGVSVMIGIIFGIIPANKAASKNLIEIL